MRIEGKLWFSEQVVQMLVEDIRASLYRQTTPEQVSLALQETSDRLAKRLDADNAARRQEPPQKPLPESACTLGCVVKAPSTLGTFLRSFRWGHVRQLDRVSRELLARAWQAGAGPGDAPFTIDLDSTICETYGLAKEGARHHGYTGKRGYHPLLAVAAGTGDVLMARLREGRANTARGRRPLPA